MTQPAFTTPPRWNVVGQVPRTKEVGGNLQEGYDVTFQTRGGHTGTVFVPGQSYAPDTIRAQIDVLAANLDHVGQLQSED